MTAEQELWSDAIDLAGLARAADALVDIKDQPGLLVVLALLMKKADMLAEALEPGCIRVCAEAVSPKTQMEVEQ